MSSSLSHPKYRPDIDGLRAVAVLSVVIFHIFPSYMRGGFVGVDVFFVISGYLISTILFENLEKGKFSFFEFYSRRVRRIFPALLLVLTTSYILGWFTLLASEYKQLGKHIAGGASFISNFVLWNEASYFDDMAQSKPLLHLWSLGVEEQFYIVYPILLWCVWKKKASFLGVTLAIAAISFGLNIAGIKKNGIATFYSPQTRFWELMCGSLLAWVTLYKQEVIATFRKTVDDWISTAVHYKLKKFTEEVSGNLTSFFGSILLSFGFWKFHNAMAFPGKWAVIPVFGSVLILFAGQKAWINRVFLSNRIAIWFGLISFPLYLWHWVLLFFVHLLEKGNPSGNLRITAIGLSIVLAWLTYILVERPVRFGKHNRLKVTVLTSFMAILLCVGYYTKTKNGLEFREINLLNENVSLALSYDSDKGFRHGECFLGAVDEKTNTFSHSCSPNERQNKPLILIWGDSHAASLYRGFLSYSQKYNFELAQYTASWCPPILDFDIVHRKECMGLNFFTFNQIKKLKPTTLVMAGYWSSYRGEKKSEMLDFEKLETTIQKVKTIGIKNIILMGSLTTYKIKQADMLRRIFANEKITTRTYRNFNELALEFDAKIETVTKKTDIHFISPLNLLCNKLGCLLSTGEDSLTPLSFDYGHLTTIGSEYLVSLFFRHNLIALNP